VEVQQIEESTKEVRETSKLGGHAHIWLFPIGAFTLFNCELVTTQNISFVGVQQIEESTKEVRQTSKLGGHAHI
jgi:hypothetical protein